MRFSFVPTCWEVVAVCLAASRSNGVSLISETRCLTPDFVLTFSSVFARVCFVSNSNLF